MNAFYNNLLKGFIETSFVDWPGKIASVVFLPGCSFSCGWCHNRMLLDAPDKLDTPSFSQVVNRITELKQWVDGIVVTGGEPTIHSCLPELVGKLNQLAPVKLDTNGSRPEMLEFLLNAGLLAGVSMDIKAPLETDYYTRVAAVPVDIDQIKRSIKLILESGLWYEFRTTVLPGMHTREDIETMEKQLKELNGGGELKRPLKLQAFKPGEHLPEPWCSKPAVDLDSFR